ncbi:TPA: hypothetical protein P5J50_001802 [Legionella pneumophila]|nr:hypothetical protein [Legionella pneumophila]HDO7884503.1 hypothetical protein [Legionella pneumophila]HDO8047174.1 hypothetical protein [Legionella pneumophila]HDO8055440.1 hypothetical protein [Legionella pneumophila]HDO8149253.1 hypothetical protein [Legionella pneumophila]
MTIPKIIQQQLLHTNKAIIWSWGVSKWYEISKTALALRVHARYLNGFVCIELDEGQDLYTISFFLNTSIEDMLVWPVIPYKPMKGVYCDQLVEFIDNRIEKIPNYKY